MNGRLGRAQHAFSMSSGKTPLCDRDFNSDFEALLAEAKQEDMLVAAAVGKKQAEEEAAKRKAEAERSERAREKRRTVADRRAKKSRAEAQKRAAKEKKQLASVAAEQDAVMQRLAERERNLAERERMLSGPQKSSLPEMSQQWSRITRQIRRVWRKHGRTIVAASIGLAVALWFATLEVSPGDVGSRDGDVKSLLSFVQERPGNERPAMFATAALARYSLGQEMDQMIANSASQVRTGLGCMLRHERWPV